MRYFAWTLFFPMVWNILELARAPRFGESPTDSPGWTHRRKAWLLAAFLAILAIETPIEARMMYRILTRRSATMRTFERAHLEVLRERRGIASDIGYIGYFSGASICDLAGLVNGRAAARLSNVERNRACAQTDPDFIFGNVAQLTDLTAVADLSGWQVCGRYDFANVRELDSHYLIVRPSIAEEVCHATQRAPEALESLLGASPAPPTATAHAGSDKIQQRMLDLYRRMGG